MTRTNNLWTLGIAMLVVAMASGKRASAKPDKGGADKGGADASAKRLELERLLLAAEDFAGLERLALFGVAVAWSESRFNNLAINNTPTEAERACKGWKKNKDSMYANNPWRNDADWCFGSGGWFGQLPSSALSGKGYREMDPRLVFDPASSVAFFTSMVFRLIPYMADLPQSDRTWLALRRGMASTTLVKDASEAHAKSALVRKHFQQSIAANDLKPTDFLFSPVSTVQAPNNTALYGHLKAIE